MTLKLNEVSMYQTEKDNVSESVKTTLANLSDLWHDAFLGAHNLYKNCNSWKESKLRIKNFFLPEHKRTFLSLILLPLLDPKQCLKTTKRNLSFARS